MEGRRLHAAGRRDLVRNVRWVSRDDGDGAGYDVRSFDPKTGRERLIEVKTTRGVRTTPFFLTRNEEALSRERPAEWRSYRVFEFAAAPRIFTLEPPLDRAGEPDAGDLVRLVQIKRAYMSGVNAGQLAAKICFLSKS